VGNASGHILVTGGAGYIGSHTAKALATHGYTPVAYDNLSNGHRSAVKWGPFVQGDIGNKAEVRDAIRRYDVRAIMHFAAFAYVGESMQKPERYFENNVSKSLALLEVALETGIRHVVFSSSCATYGIPERMPITEDTPQHPVNPYGETKLALERALYWYSKAGRMNSVALRYFNAAGADLDGDIGEDHSPETHLIPLVLEAAMGGRVLEVYGDDYPTRDGTCVRDFIHVSDLADAHVRALDYLLSGGGSSAVNLGTGIGHTIKEVISAAERVTGRKVMCRIAPRRPGDPAVLVADPKLSEEVLAWKPKHSQLDSIIGSAWKWCSEHAGACSTGQGSRSRSDDRQGS
jgi:UDP-arabinose 4-epimerase